MAAYILMNSGYTSLEECISIVFRIQFATLLGTISSVFLISKYNRRTILISTMIPQTISLFIISYNGWTMMHMGNVNIEYIKRSSFFCMVVYLFFQNCAQASMPSIVNSEIHPYKLREIMISISTATYQIANFVVAIYAPKCISTLSSQT